MNRQTLIRTVAGVLVIAIVALLMYAETIPESAGTTIILAIAAGIGLYERGLRKPQP
jgi:hypothetical protein